MITFDIFHVIISVTVTFVSDYSKQFPLLISRVDIIKSTGCVKIGHWALVLCGTLLRRSVYIYHAGSGLLA
jgi:hypothetical protein